jgi:hypothetical protein
MSVHGRSSTDMALWRLVAVSRLVRSCVSVRKRVWGALLNLYQAEEMEAETARIPNAAPVSVRSGSACFSCEGTAQR